MDFSFLTRADIMKTLLDGLLVTLEVALFSILFSFICGIVLGTLRYTKIPVLSHLAALYIETVRNLPLLLIIFFGFFAFKEWGWELPITISVIISMTIFTSALVGEIVRGGLNSVDKGQIEAARASGLTYVQTLWHIVLPQALRRMIPPMVSQFVSLLKDTSLAVAISLPELMHNAQIVYSRYYNMTVPLLIFVSLVYFVINYRLSQASRQLEKKLSG